jgi:D-alanine-D-alanine ligase
MQSTNGVSLPGSGEARRALRVLVLMGGPDAEREVSLMSGAEVAKALASTGRFEVLERVIERTSAEELLALRPDVIYPVVHGPWGEGGPLQEILEALALSHGIPYVGPRPLAAAIAMDKLRTKVMAAAVGVRTPRARELRPGEALDLDPETLGSPVVLKPSNDGSSVDLRICRTGEALRAARAELEAKRPHLMAEEFIRGREMTVGIVNGEVLPIIEIVPAVEFYDYEAKYFRDDTRYVVDPELPEAHANEMRDATRAVFSRIGLRDAARADFMVDERGAWFLEINTAPGMTTHSLVPMASRHRGVDMPELCASLVDAAWSRRVRASENAQSPATAR